MLCLECLCITLDAIIPSQNDKLKLFGSYLYIDKDILYSPKKKI